VEGKRFDVIGATQSGPTVLASLDEPKEAAEAAKKAAFEGSTLVEVWDRELERVVFRARGGEWRWVTR
jgi:hypothetical protein